MFDKITEFMDTKLSTPMAKLAEQRHLRAVRDGIIATLPIIIVASMFLVIAFLPNSLPKDWGITQFIQVNQAKILLPYRVSMYIMTLYAVFGIGFSLSSSYDLDGLSGGILAELAYLLTIVPKVVPAASAELKTLAETSEPLKKLFIFITFRFCFTDGKFRVSRYVYRYFISLSSSRNLSFYSKEWI